MDESKTAAPESAGKDYRPLVAIALLIVVAVALRTLPLGGAFVIAVEWFRHAGVIGVLSFWVLHVLCTAVSLPNSPFALAAGYLYGVAWGLTSALASSLLAAVFAFALGRTIARRWVSDRIRGYQLFAAIEEAVLQEPIKVLVLLRISPLMPFALINYSLALTRVPFGTYALTALIGGVPGGIMLVYVGSLADHAAKLLDGSSEEGAAARAVYWGGLVATVIVTLLVTRLARRALARRLGAIAAGSEQDTRV